MHADWQRTLRRLGRTRGADWVVPCLVAALWAALISFTRGSGLGLTRTWVALGGPAVFLAGLHARTEPYLHAAERRQTSVLPIPARTHFAAASVAHRRSRLRVALVGTMALALALTKGWPPGVALSLMADWGLFALVAIFVEPLAPAVASWLGRRFPPQSVPAQLQRTLGGGWTLPEAVVHLYAPVMVLGFAMMLALPGQLAIDRWADQLARPPWLDTAAVAAVVVAACTPWIAPRLYALGFFEAVPFLTEASKTLAGPPVPESTPTWIRWLPDPSLRLWVLQFHRLTPLPTLRLLLVLAAVPLALRVQDPAIAAAVLGAAVLLWVMPASVVSAQRPHRARWMAALPLPAAQREGRHPWAAVLLWFPPAVAATIVTLARISW